MLAAEAVEASCNRLMAGRGPRSGLSRCRPPSFRLGRQRLQREHLLTLARPRLAKMQRWFTPAEVLRMATHDNAQLLAMSGPRDPYPGRLGVVEEGALADLLLVDGDPLQELSLVATPDKSFVVIMKDGKLHKNTLVD
jgi:cytosine/adenosine deaminase-related metal-dependent hydrolase